VSQQEFWKGSFGNEYIERNKSDHLKASNLVLFSEILKSSGIAPKSILELGANIGLNLLALKQLIPNCETTGVEINDRAASIEEVEIIAEYDLVFTKGVLIHLDPQSLESVYKKIYDSSSRWILTIEYYSRSPQEIMYRGHENVLFKRDFAGELLDIYQNKLLLLDYGFIYHRDTYPQDDLTWFLMEKQQ
jgi:pseudaminic acid biosynthesis-associated methylase